MISAVNTKLLMSATVKTPLHVSGCHIATMAVVVILLRRRHSTLNLETQTWVETAKYLKLLYCVYLSMHHNNTGKPT